MAEKLERRRLELEREDAQQQEFLRTVAQMENVAEELNKTTVYDNATDEFKPIDELSNDDEEDDVVELTMPEAPRPASATLLAPARPAPSMPAPAKLPRPRPKLVGVKVEPRVASDLDREVMEALHKLNKAEAAKATAEAAQPDSGAAGSAAGSSGAAGSAAGSSGAAGSGGAAGSSGAADSGWQWSEKGHGFQVPEDVKAAKGTGKSGTIAYEDGTKLQFGKRGTFAVGEVQGDPSTGFQRGPSGPDDHWRSGSGRWGGRGQGSNAGWSRINLALFNNSAAAKGLFRARFPLEAKPHLELNDRETQQWYIKWFMDQADIATGKKGDIAKGKGGKKGHVAKGSSRSPPTPPPAPQAPLDPWATRKP